MQMHRNMWEYLRYKNALLLYILCVGLNNKIYKTHGTYINPVVRYILQQPGCAEENHKKKPA
jgi:hypothetical protein